MVLQSLLTDAQTDPASELAASIMLLSLWPGLDAIRGRLLRYFRGNVADLDGELVGRLSLAIRTANRGRVNRIAATLLRNLERDLRRQMMREADQQAAQTSVDPDVLPSDDDCDDLSRDALATHLIARFPRDADLLAFVWIDAMSQKAAGAALGLSHDQARKRVQRARRSLGTAYDNDPVVAVSHSSHQFGFSHVKAPNGAPQRDSER